MDNSPLGKQLDLRLVEKQNAFNGTRRFITVFTEAHHFFFSFADDFSSRSRTLLFRIHFNSILPFTPRSVQLSRSFMSSHQNMHIFSVFPYVLDTQPIASSFNREIISAKKYQLSFLTAQISPVPCYFVPIRT